MVLENRESYAFIQTVNAHETLTMTRRILAEGGRVKRVKIIIPDGPDGNLKLYPSFNDSKGNPKEIIAFSGSDNYISGNNLDLDLYTDTPIEMYSTLSVVAVNDGDFAYPVQVFIEVEYLQVMLGGAR